jgi:hypothetical protein
MVYEKNLPNNESINKIKSINYEYFYGKGEWLSGFSPVSIGLHLRPCGYELYVNVTVDLPYKPFKFSLFFNEHNTEQEIEDELKQLKHLTDNFKYKYTVG